MSSDSQSISWGECFLNAEIRWYHHIYTAVIGLWFWLASRGQIVNRVSQSTCFSAPKQSAQQVHWCCPIPSRRCLESRLSGWAFPPQRTNFKLLPEAALTRKSASCPVKFGHVPLNRLRECLSHTFHGKFSVPIDLWLRGVCSCEYTHRTKYCLAVHCVLSHSPLGSLTISAKLICVIRRTLDRRRS